MNQSRPNVKNRNNEQILFTGLYEMEKFICAVFCLTREAQLNSVCMHSGLAMQQAGSLLHAALRCHLATN